MNKLKKSRIEINRKRLSQLAIVDIISFQKLQYIINVKY
jgi:ribosomal protein L20